VSFPHQVKIVEVGPRDGLQNEKQAIPTKVKIDFINQLSATGLPVIEATSFVSRKWIPQLGDASEVFQGIEKKANVHYPVLVPNLKGLEAAIAVGVKEIAVFSTPSEQFSQHNTNCTVAESLGRIEELVNLAKKNNIKVRAYVSCVLGCPYEGEITAEKVANLSKLLLQMGCYEISLGDTIGVGTPTKTKKLLEIVSKYVPFKSLAVHFHDTYGQALVNIYAALECGVSVVDSSVSGLGGCPYAKGATGNVATEDVVYLLNGMGVETGVDLKKIIEVGKFISKKLGRRSQSKVNLTLGSE
jgi:hydroxymethylglutaryl-CoA lyase